MLRWLGHEHTALLDGGYGAWLAAGLPTTADLPAVSPCTYEIQSVHEDWIVTTADLLGAIGSGAVRLLDARSARRFQGVEEPIDTVAGHVPGALSCPFDSNLDDKRKLLPAEALRAKLGPLLGEDSAATTVAMCGSGVTACHLLLALEEAGITGARLYAGSWSEWIRDPSRPIATGA